MYPVNNGAIIERPRGGKQRTIAPNLGRKTHKGRGREGLRPSEKPFSDGLCRSDKVRSKPCMRFRRVARERDGIRDAAETANPTSVSAWVGWETGCLKTQFRSSQKTVLRIFRRPLPSGRVCRPKATHVVLAGGRLFGCWENGRPSENAASEQPKNRILIFRRPVEWQGMRVSPLGGAGSVDNQPCGGVFGKNTACRVKNARRCPPCCAFFLIFGYFLLKKPLAS